MAELPSAIVHGTGGVPWFNRELYVGAFSRLVSRPGDHVAGWGGAREAVRRFADGLSLIDEDGALHCATGPAEVTVVGPPWRVVEADWCNHGEHVLTVVFTEHGSAWEVHRLEAGIPHSEDRPAVVLLRSDGTVEGEEWWRAGQRHRNHGPALVSYDVNGVVAREAWFSAGEELSGPVRERRPTRPVPAPGTPEVPRQDAVVEARGAPPEDIPPGDCEPEFESELWFEDAAILGDTNLVSYSYDEWAGIEEWRWTVPATSVERCRRRWIGEIGVLRDEWFEKDAASGQMVRHRSRDPAVTTFEHGREVTERWFNHGNLKTTRTFSRRSDGSVRCEQWEQEGLMGRDDGPAALHDRPDGSLESEHWYGEGVVHRNGGPAVRWYRRDGTVQSEHWYDSMDLHRDHGPARIWYREDGSIEKQSWYTKGLHQRSALLRADGSVEREEWYLREWSIREGELHRVDGPAVVRYHPDGGIENEEWWLDGELQRREGALTSLP